MTRFKQLFNKYSKTRRFPKIFNLLILYKQQISFIINEQLHGTGDLHIVSCLLWKQKC